MSLIVVWNAVKNKKNRSDLVLNLIFTPPVLFAMLLFWAVGILILARSNPKVFTLLGTLLVDRLSLIVMVLLKKLEEDLTSLSSVTNILVCGSKIPISSRPKLPSPSKAPMVTAVSISPFSEDWKFPKSISTGFLFTNSKPLKVAIYCNGSFWSS